MNQYFTFKEWDLFRISREVTINLKYLVSVRYLEDDVVSVALVNGEEHNFENKNREFEAVLNKYAALSE